MKQGGIFASVIALLVFSEVAVAVSPTSAETCSDFQSFLEQFGTNKTFQLDHTKWPLYVANVSLCDKNGNPRIDAKSGQPYPKDWCGRSMQRERFKNGVFIVRSLRERSHIRQTVGAEKGRGTVVLACDPAHKSVCGSYWMKYYFSRNSQGCWQLERWEQRTE